MTLSRLPPSISRTFSFSVYTHSRLIHGEKSLTSTLPPIRIASRPPPVAITASPYQQPRRYPTDRADDAVTPKTNTLPPPTVVSGPVCPCLPFLIPLNITNPVRVGHTRHEQYHHPY
ncbi:pollen-specific leucine-rich repeat extensin-like protein 4 [Iris pallida]|uniref:Pollen-specific leucine-rich repeat extensin-like protein 4 n=1 Tax=Iris pallida TaxID=29817 RepID=A0AAX6H311_IRIPA|nr:pollen-specific leucine-rich repeat extensin-like protein 4 [Iris pallida]